MTKKALVVLSGGQDSTTCLYWAIDRYGKENVLQSALTTVKGIKQSLNVQEKFVMMKEFRMKLLRHL